jgi:hypothetical protein
LQCVLAGSALPLLGLGRVGPTVYRFWYSTSDGRTHEEPYSDALRYTDYQDYPRFRRLRGEEMARARLEACRRDAVCHILGEYRRGQLRVLDCGVDEAPARGDGKRVKA